MQDVTVAQAKEHLEELMERASRGEEVCITDERLGTMKLQPVPAESARAEVSEARSRTSRGKSSYSRRAAFRPTDR